MTNDKKALALICAVIHYGLANLATGSKPPKPETVIAAAKAFEQYL